LFTKTNEGNKMQLLVHFETAAQIAQLVEHATENRSVTGSIPVLGTTLSNVSHFI
jgi:hypothetical protein